MRILWSPQARGDLRDIFLYLAPHNPMAARSLISRVRECVELLAERPQIGRPGRVPGTREMAVSGTRYVIPYRMVGETLQVLRVYHAARQWPGSFD